MFIQYLLYRKPRRKVIVEVEPLLEDQETTSCTEEEQEQSISFTSGAPEQKIIVRDVSQAFFAVSPFVLSLLVVQLSQSSLEGSSRRLLGTGHAYSSICNSPPDLNSVSEIIGSICSWASGLLYLFSRIPQVVRNFQRKSVEGLSVLMFCITVSGNSFYGLSIMFRLPALDKHFFEGTLPFIVGSVCTIIFDIAILIQSRIYRPKGTEEKVLVISTD